MSVRRSKVRPPRPPAVVLTRQRLLDGVLPALGRQRVVLLQAPAGYGKTTTMAALLAALPASTSRAWVSLDAGDDLPSLIEALLAALDPLDLPWRRSARALRAAAEAPSSALAESFAEALAATEAAAGVLVLDDLQHADDPRLHRWLDLFVDELPPCWTVMIGCRGRPPLALTRWQLRGELLTVDQAALAFAAAEARALAQALGVRDTPALQALIRRAAGWPAALRLGLAVDPAPAGAGPASDPHPEEGLAIEVIDRLPEALRRFALHTAVLPELSTRRCIALTGDAEAARHLEAMRRLDLFVSVVDDDGSMRLHELFRHALLRRLREDAPDDLARLLHRAAQGERDPARRVDWLLQAGDTAAAETELEAASAALITDGRGATVQALLGRFAPGHIARSLPLAIVQARLAWSRWDGAAMRQALEQVPAVVRAAAPPALRDLFDAYHAVALDSVCRDAAAAQRADTLRARPLAPLPRLLVLQCGEADDLATAVARRHESVALADALGTADAWYQALPVLSQVVLPGTEAPLQHMAQAMRALSADEPNPLHMWSLVLQAWLAFWRGDTAEALDAAHAAQLDAAWDGATAGALPHLHGLCALLHAVRGEAAASARALVRQRETEVAPADPRQARLHAGTRQGGACRAAAALGDLAALRAALADWPVPTSGATHTLALARQAAEAQALALAGAVDEAEAAWSALLPVLWRLEGQGEAGAVRLRLAAARVTLGRLDAAAGLLEGGIDPARAPLAPALLAGPNVLRALADAPWSDAGADTRRQGLREALGRVEAQRRHAGPPADADDRRLSAREREVLAHIARGDGNKRIAQRLALSPHTVKRHVANILDKLDLRSRGQAAAWWAREERTGR